MDPRVMAALEPARALLADLGCEVADAEPDWSGADEAFKTLRASAFAQGFAAMSDRALGRLKPTVGWNVAQGRALSGADLRQAARLRTRLHDRLAAFFEQHAFLVMPVNQVPPFDVTVEYPEEIAGVAMETYIDWMKSAYFISVTGLPAISVPVGFTPEGLPVGLQIVGRPRDDFGVLQLAHAVEEASGAGRRRPPV
jgi:amidase